VRFPAEEQSTSRESSLSNNRCSSCQCSCSDWTALSSLLQWKLASNKTRWDREHHAFDEAVVGHYTATPPPRPEEEERRNHPFFSWTLRSVGWVEASRLHPWHVYHRRGMSFSTGRKTPRNCLCRFRLTFIRIIRAMMSLATVRITAWFASFHSSSNPISSAWRLSQSYHP